MTVELALLVVLLAIALALRPWRMLAGAKLAVPLLATLVLLPWVWALPFLLAMPLQPHWSGACLVLLMLGWPLALPALCAVALFATLLSPMNLSEAVGLAFWQGAVPATLALALGALIRRYIGTHPFVYLLGRTFIGTALSTFAAGVLWHAAGHVLPRTESNVSLVAQWMMAWGDAFVTGMLCSIFVAFKPEWLATWSDTLYLDNR